MEGEGEGKGEGGGGGAAGAGVQGAIWRKSGWRVRYLVERVLEMD